MKPFYSTIAALLLLALPAFRVAGQAARVEASIDSSAILVGHQTRIRLDLLQPSDRSLYRPLLKDTLTAGIELLDISQPDTLSENDGRLALRQELLVTSFDSGFYYIPPVRYANGIDTIRSNGLSLKVVTLDVDTVNAEFYDIKSVEAPPFVWGDYLYILWIVLGVAALALAGYLFYRWRTDRPLLKPQSKEPALPPHERALEALNRLKEEKLWQNGREKEYYTRVTDILRVYLEERFGVNAMEMTSQEILAAFRGTEQDGSVFRGLKEVLEVADFVKFAKLRPTEEENEMSMIHALFFVNQTKIDEPAPVEGGEAGNTPAGSAPSETDIEK